MVGFLWLAIPGGSFIWGHSTTDEVVSCQARRKLYVWLAIPGGHS